MSYVHYENMSTSKKDKMVDGMEIQKAIEDYEGRKNIQHLKDVVTIPTMIFKKWLMMNFKQ